LDAVIVNTPKPWTYGIDYGSHLIGKQINIILFIPQEWSFKNTPFCSDSNVSLLVTLNSRTHVQTLLPNAPKPIVANSTLGLGIGGTVNSSLPWRVWVDNALSTGKWTYDALSGGTHSLTPPNMDAFHYSFRTTALVVYGLGTPAAINRQRAAHGFEAREAQKRAQVNVRNADGNVDRELLRMAGLIGDLDAMGVVRAETVDEPSN